MELLLKKDQPDPDLVFKSNMQIFEILNRVDLSQGQAGLNYEATWKKSPARSNRLRIILFWNGTFLEIER